MPCLAAAAMEEVSELVPLVVYSGLLFFPVAVMQSAHCLKADMHAPRQFGKGHRAIPRGLKGETAV